MGSFLGTITGSDKATEAAIAGSQQSAAAIQAATEKNIDFQKWLWGEQTALTQPYAEMGAGAIGQYQEALAKPLTMDEVYQEPGYQFGLQQGRQAVETSGSARGMQLSGAQQKAQTRFGTDYASTKYGEAAQRRQMNLDNLYRMINSGQAAVGAQMGAGAQMGQSVGQSILGAGQAQAQSLSDIGNIKAAGATSGFNTLLDIGQLAASAYSPAKKAAVV